MSTGSHSTALAMVILGPIGEWQSSLPPKNRPFFARSAKGASPVLHMDNWLTRAIHGPQMEWAEARSV